MSDKNIFSNPSIRLVIQILILFNFVYFAELQINDVRIDFLNHFLSNNIFNIFFTVFCLAILVNGTNFLDGLNGLVSSYYLIVLLSIIYLIDNNLNLIEVEFLKIVFLALIIFYFFNILGFVYLGDSGTYAVALLVGAYLIKFYLLNIFISPFYIAVLLWYPAFENLFSLSRRIIGKRNVSDADNYHLHHYLYKFVKNKFEVSKLFANNLTSIIINLFNFIIFYAGSEYKNLTHVQLLLIVLSILFYFSAYFLLKNILKNKFD